MADQLSLPDLLTQQALLQQRQKFGQQLLQQANTPNPVFQQPASGGPYGVVPKYGLGNGLVTLGQALIGAKMTRDASRDYAQLMGNGWQGTPQPPPANIPDDPSQNATTPSEPGYQPPPAAYGQALSSGPLAGVDPQTVRMIALTEGPAGLSKLAATIAEKRLEPTEFARDLIGAGIMPGTPEYARQFAQHLAKTNYIAPVEHRVNSLWTDALTNEPIGYNPGVPTGAVPTFAPGTSIPNGVYTLPGAAQAQQSAAAANALGGAQADVVEATLSDGSKVWVPKTTLLHQQPGQQQAPQQQAPQQGSDRVPALPPAQPSGVAAPANPRPADPNDPNLYRTIPRPRPGVGMGQSTTAAAMGAEQGKDWAERETKINDDAKSAQEKIAQNNEMLKIVPTVNTGPLAEDITHLKGVLNELGIEGFDPSKPQEFEKFARQGAVALAKQIYGPRITNADLDNQIKSNPGMNLAQKANYEILKLDNMRQQRFLDQQSAYYNYKNRGGDLSQFDPWFTRTFPNWGGVSARANPKPGDLTPPSQPSVNMASETRSLNGKTYYKINGKWYTQ